MNNKESHPDRTQYLTFRLDSEEYAIGILQVREIIAYETLTKVPQTPPSIRGVINLRGNVVPIVDLRLKFGLTAGRVTDRTCIVIVEAHINGILSVVGVLADSVSQVIGLSENNVFPAPIFGTRLCADYLLGMGRSDDGLVLLLDIDKVLSADDAITMAAQCNASEAKTVEAL